jgi:hypothetical protein
MARSMAKLEKIVERVLVAQEKSTQETIAMRDSLKKMSGDIGGLRNSIGDVVEQVLLPGLKSKMNELNHNFTMSSYRKQFSRRDGSTLAEVDLFLENCEEVMVVETKTWFNEDNVERLLRRLKTLRENEAITGLRGKTMYAAAAGFSFTDEARQMLEENETGIYIVDVDEDNDKIKVMPPADGKSGKW